MKNHLWILGLSAALLFSACDGGNNLPPGGDTVPHPPAGLPGSFSIQAFNEGEALSLRHRAWFHGRALEFPEERILDFDPRIEPTSPAGIRAMQEPTSGMKEGVDYFFDDEGRVWRSCDYTARADIEETWCGVILPSICYDFPCAFEFRIANEALPDGVTADNDWNADPSSWASGQFIWDEEFGSFEYYLQAYEAAELEYLRYPNGGPFVDLKIEGGVIQTRGWIRRLKEEQGIIVEPAVQRMIAGAAFTISF